MIVDDFDVVGAIFFPDEAKAVAVIDADAVLPDSIAAQPLQPVSWRPEQVVKAPGCIQIFELPPRGGLDHSKPCDPGETEQRLGFPALERANHDNNASRY